MDKPVPSPDAAASSNIQGKLHSLYDREDAESTSILLTREARNKFTGTMRDIFFKNQSSMDERNYIVDIMVVDSETKIVMNLCRCIIG
mmetsp:Transcript_25364/g.24308  ORF Transcript_25364/g.24308 Transcript_25364/m.24308 type:complete len:88 (-) Transcript_25364:2517-2780(-)